MKKNTLSILSIVLCLSAFVLWNCNGPRPASPTSLATVNVAMPVSGGKDDAFSVTNDIIEYVVTGPGMSSINGSTTISSSNVSGGTANFSVNVQSGPQRILAVEAKDLVSNQPLALGAVQFDLSSNTSSSNLTVELGSLTRTCYVVNTLGIGETAGVTAGTFSFTQDFLTSAPYTYGPTWDFQLTPDGAFGTGYYFTDAGYAGYPGYYSDIAYMGNGDLVNFAYVPNSSSFQPYSYSSKLNALASPTPTPNPATVLPSVVSNNVGNDRTNSLVSASLLNGVNVDVQVGDVYCIQSISIPGAYAWVQITSAGIQNVAGPSFIYRACSTAPFFAFQRTGADTGAAVTCNSN